MNMSQYSLEGSDSCSSYNGARPKRRGFLPFMDARMQEQARLEKLRELKLAASKIKLNIKEQFTNKPVNMYIPKKIDPRAYTEEVSFSSLKNTSNKFS